MKYALLYATGINRYSTIPNIMKQVRESMQMLVEIFGLPDKEQMRNELLPLFEQYDYIIKMKYIEDAIKTLGLAWD